MQYYVVDSNDPNGDLGNVCIAAVENSKFSCETLLLARQVKLAKIFLNKLIIEKFTSNLYLN